MMIGNPNLHIRRFEFKYIVHGRELDKIRRSIKNYAIADPFAKNASEGIYNVHSLYLDDVNLSSYYEKLAGVKRRKKMRIRTYDNSLISSSKVYLEIKKRDEVIIFKDRSLVPFRDVTSALEDGLYDKLLTKGEAEVTKQFVCYFISRSLRPKALISYTREAYLDSKNYSFRVTLDQNLCARRSYDLDFKKQGLKEIFPGFAIVEAKFNRIMPAWFSHIARTYNLERVSFSKYCFGLESCGIVPKTDLSSLPIHGYI